MTGTMVERVAAALCTVEWEDGNKFPAMSTADREYWMDSARAAIEAMREPTEAVADAIYEAETRNGTSPEVWRAAIDAALQEENGHG